MKKLFTILCVMTCSNIFCVGSDGATDIDLETDITISFDPTNTRPSFDERGESISEFLDEITNSEAGTEIQVPFSSEIHIVKSGEEIVQRLLNHPDNCYDLLLGNIILKEDARLLEGVKQLPDDMPNIVLDPSGMTGLDTLSESQLMSMAYVQLTNDYSKLTTDHLNSHSKTCYNQMFVFLRMAKWEAEDIWDGPLRRAATSAIEKAMETLAQTGSPKKAIVYGLYKGIIKFAMNVNENLTEMYSNLESAILWAEALDDCGTEQAKRIK